MSSFTVLNDMFCRMAYAVYRTGEVALSAAKEYANSSIELEGNILKIYKYHVPVENVPRGDIIMSAG
jgi:hypothetical protein